MELLEIDRFSGNLQQMSETTSYNSIKTIEQVRNPNVNSSTFIGFLFISFFSLRKSFTSIYSKDDRINWHQHWDNNTLLVGHDSYVDRMDLRDGKGWRNFINVTNGTKIAVSLSNLYLLQQCFSKLLLFFFSARKE